MSLIVLDTDVASALLRSRAPDTIASALAGQVPAVTFVTVGELTKWTLVRRWGPQRLETMRVFLASLVVLPYDRRVAARWGELQAYAQMRGRPRPRTTAGLRPVAWSVSYRSPRSTSRTSPNSPSTRALNWLVGEGRLVEPSVERTAGPDRLLEPDPDPPTTL